MDFVIHLTGGEEEHLIKACINNERWAQKKLYEDNYPTLMSISMRYAGTQEDALDILHESFIKVFRNIHLFNPGTSLLAWMRRSVINTAIDYYRKDVRRKAEPLDLAVTSASDLPDAVSHLTSEEILKALQRLPGSYRSVFNLYVIEGYSHKEISEMLHINESTCRSNLVKARNRLKAMLTESGIV
jgi:RNA polymerase sigma-70 factor (ECF subfamily)